MFNKFKKILRNFTNFQKNLISFSKKNIDVKVILEIKFERMLENIDIGLIKFKNIYRKYQNMFKTFFKF